MRNARSLGGLLVAVVAVVAVWWLQGDGATRDRADARPTASASTGSTPSGSASTDPESGLPWIDERDLPPEGRDTLALIDQGGPYPFPDHDDSVFSNFEGVLPDEATGYYHEYTVVTPGSQDRGARRIVTGEGGQFYYTDDHYRSFERIRR